MQPVLKSAVLLPKAQRAPVQHVLGNFFLRNLEHLRKCRVLPEVAYALEFGVGIYGSCYNLHQGNVYVHAVPASHGEVLAYLQHTQSGVAEVLPADGTCLVLGERTYLYGDGIKHCLTLLPLGLGYKYRIVLPGILALTVFGIELDGFLIELDVLMHNALAFLYHHGEHVGKFLTFTFGKFLQTPHAKDAAVMLFALGITVGLG